MLDKEAIREDADLFVVADELRVPIFTKRRRSLIYCPCHNDHHLGSCYITNKKFYCYSCHAEVDVFAFVQAVLNVGFPEALKIVADICGGAEQYEVTDADAIQQIDTLRFISRKQQEAIGIISNPIYAHIGMADYDDIEELRNEGYVVEQENDSTGEQIGYSVKKRVLSNPLLELYKEDRDAYRDLIDDFCIRKIESYQFAYRLLSMPPAMLPDYTAEFIAKIKSIIPEKEIADIFSKQIREIQGISLTHGLGRAVKQQSDFDGNHIMSQPTNPDVLATAKSIWAQKKEAPF